MSSFCGNNLRLALFGESHGPALGLVMEGLPAGINLDLDFIKEELRRRQPGTSSFSTARAEKDHFEILSGFYKGKTTGTPLSILIRNEDQKSSDYQEEMLKPRPGHADLTGYLKYSGHNDHRGGGHFSGRLTAPLVFAGALAKGLLEKEDITIASHIKSIDLIQDDSFQGEDLNKEALNALTKERWPLLNKGLAGPMQAAILAAKEEGDSLGGTIEGAIINLEAGLGEPFFNSMESMLAKAFFSIPAVKGVEFGAGFQISQLKGSQANDAFSYQDGQLVSLTNNNGGLLGGITTGMPVIFRLAIKPTPSISLEQKTVNLKTKTNSTISTQGRHDPCIVPRALVVVEAMAALVSLDFLLQKENRRWSA